MPRAWSRESKARLREKRLNTFPLVLREETETREGQHFRILVLDQEELEPESISSRPKIYVSTDPRQLI